jgi:N-acetylmuramoyl-L-alanine amidase
VQFPQIMRDQLVGSGIPPSIYVGSGGLNPRADIAELNVVQFRRSWSSAAT